jgi:hypothetical protein
MSRFGFLIPALLLVSGPIAAPGSARAQAVAQTTCEWYARTAVKQQQENEQKKCGFKGPAWTSDLKAHQIWCAGVSPEEWRRSAQKRDQDLAACGRK